MPLRAYLSSIGDSLVIGEDDECFKVHVHTDIPGHALTEAQKYGTLELAKIENMRTQRDDLAAGRQAHSTDDLDAVEEELEAQENAVAPAEKRYGFVAVCAGDGLADTFRALGVDTIVSGGQTMNPSTEAILKEVNRTPSEVVFILPNNKNIIMAANQAVDLVEDKQIIVIPTKTIPQGITALVNYIPDHSAEENKEQMMAEIENVKTGQVTYAVRDTEIDGKTIKQNDFMGIGDKSILSVGTDLMATTLEMVDAMVDEDSAIVSIYFGSDSDEDSANELAAAIEEKYPDVEVEVNDGGQPIYYYVISVE